MKMQFMKMQYSVLCHVLFSVLNLGLLLSELQRQKFGYSVLEQMGALF